MYPNSIELEKSVLGCLMLGKLDKILELDESNFLNDANKLVYKAIRHMYDKKLEVDVVSVSDILKKRMSNAFEHMTNLMDYVASPENVTHYIENLKDYTARRKVIMAAEKATEMALRGDFENRIELKSNVLQLFDFKVDNRKKTDCGIAQIMVEVFEDIDKKYNAKNEEKLFMGFYDLDKITAGLHPKELTLIAARPGVGKSTFALQIMINLAKKENKCLFVSREMSRNQIGARILSNLAAVDGQKLRFCKTLNDVDWEKMHDAIGEISEYPIEINDSLMSVQEIRAYCQELENNDKLDVLIIDYLQLCKSLKKSENRRQEIEDISRQLKEISTEFSIPVIALSQLSRESVAAKEPELHHLRESGSLEQDADNVIFLHIPADTNEAQEHFDIKVIVAKQRNGPIGFTWIKYYRRTFKLCNIHH